MAEAKGPLDELQWRAPEIIEYYKGIRPENIHLYFMYSPFCDVQSNNKLLLTQLSRNASLFPVLENRGEFEARLRMMPGLGYFVIDGPEKSSQEYNPVWVIRGERRMRDNNQMEVVGTYYAVGENIYQAPSLLDVITCRLLSITDHLQNIHETAANMQFFSPAQGYSSLKSPLKLAAKDTDLLKSGTTDTPARSASPGAESVTQSNMGSKDNQPDQEKMEDDELWRSLQMSLAYADDFIDLNPLIGEPGSFKFSSTQSHAYAQQQAAAKAAAAKAAQETKSTLPSGKTTAAPTPIPQDTKPPAPIRRGSKTPTTGNKTLKRKKTSEAV